MPSSVAGLDQGLGNAAQAETANSHELAVLDDTLEGLGSGGKKFIHKNLLENFNTHFKSRTILLIWIRSYP